MHPRHYRRLAGDAVPLRQRQRTPLDLGSIHDREPSSDGGFTLTGPVTITLTNLPVGGTTSRSSASTSSSSVPITSTVTTTTTIGLSTSLSRSTTTSTFSLITSSTSSTSQSTASQSTASQFTASQSTPSPSVSVKGNNNSTAPGQQSNISTSAEGLSTGAIIGIVIGCLVVLMGAAVFVIRRRSVSNRLRLRGMWTKSRKVAVGPPVGSWEIKEDSPLRFPPARSQMSNVKSPVLPASLTRAQAESKISRAPLPSTSFGSDVSVGLNPVTRAAGSPPIMADISLKSSVAALGVAVICTFIPQLPDELSITTGEKIRVLAEYDDGWALCVNARGEQGMVPVECLEGYGSNQLEVPDTRNFRRTSSLNSSGASSRRS